MAEAGSLATWPDSEGYKTAQICQKSYMTCKNEKKKAQEQIMSHQPKWKRDQQRFAGLLPDKQGVVRTVVVRAQRQQVRSQRESCQPAGWTDPGTDCCCAETTCDTPNTRPSSGCSKRTDENVYKELFYHVRSSIYILLRRIQALI